MNYDFKRFLNDVPCLTTKFAIFYIKEKQSVHVDKLVLLMKTYRNKRRKITKTTNNRMYKYLCFLFKIKYCVVDEELNVILNPNFIPLNQR